MHPRIVVVAVTARLLAGAVLAGWAQHRGHDVVPAKTRHDAIETLATAGLAGGFEDGTFRPDDVLTRGPFATLPATVGEAGVADGFGDGTYGPDESVSRAQAAALLVATDPRP